MLKKEGFNDRGDIIDALKTSMNLPDPDKGRKGIYYEEKTRALVIDEESEELASVKETEEEALRKAEEKLTSMKMTEEELFQKLLQQKRG